MLSVKRVKVILSGKEILKGVSLEAREAAVTALIGANGAGKTTTLRAISGLAPVKSGEIFFRGSRIDGMKSENIVKKGIVHIPEGRGLFPYMSVYDNLLTGAYLRPDKARVKNDLEKIYEYFPVLKIMRKRQARNMSGGEQQMLAFARGLIANPILLLLDEPSIGLAPLIVQQIMSKTKEIAQEKRIGVLIVEQNADLALSLADRGYVLEVGKVVLEGGGRDLMNSAEIKRAYLGM